MSVCPSAAAELSLFPSDTAALSREVEEEANSNFQRIYNHPPHPTLSIEEVLDMLKRFQDSSVPRERVSADDDSGPEPEPEPELLSGPGAVFGPPGGRGGGVGGLQWLPCALGVVWLETYARGDVMVRVMPVVRARRRFPTKRGDCGW